MPPKVSTAFSITRSTPSLVDTSACTVGDEVRALGRRLDLERGLGQPFLATCAQAHATALGHERSAHSPARVHGSIP